MNLKDLQDWVRDDWENNSKKQPNPHLQLIYLLEEMGEIAEAIRKMDGNKERKDKEVDLEGEMGDFLVALATLANNYGIDLESAVLKTKEKVARRHKEGF